MEFMRKIHWLVVTDFNQLAPSFKLRVIKFVVILKFASLFSFVYFKWRYSINLINCS